MNDTAASSGLTPYLSIDGASDAIAFYQQAFGAIERARHPGESGKLMHAHVEINGAPLFMSDFFPDHGYPPVAAQGFNLHLQVDSAQTWWDRAVAAGCTVLMPLKEEFWGDIYGQLRDPYGIRWAIAQTKAA
ncbi:glyoxalase/bleomycin resistance/extradiol dioxygenase family protein [Devosia sp.]|uniref:VOC family protein n=1 Tax=Devosia sp. TaxID=1871048 RepID=UPI003262E26C